MPNLSEFPYFDNYEPEKQFTQILALPGRVAQAREFTQVQSMYRDFLSRFADTVIKAGTTIEGCTVILPEKSESTGEFIILEQSLEALAEEGDTEIVIDTAFDDTNLENKLLVVEEDTVQTRVEIGSTSLIVSNLPTTELKLESLIRVDSNDVYEVHSFDESTNTITLTTPITATYEEGTKIEFGIMNRLIKLGGEDIYYMQLYNDTTKTITLSSELSKNYAIGTTVEYGGETIVDDGKVYIDGIIMFYKKQSIWLNGVGDEIIGVIHHKDIVTEQSDTSLFDPALGYDNYHQPGGHRIKEWLELTGDIEDDPVILWLVKDGDLILKNQYSWLFEIMANRLYDQAGNYRVWGLRAVSRDYNIEADLTAPVDPIVAIVEPGKAYVRGFEVSKGSSIHVAIDRSTDTRSVSGSNAFYREGEDTYLLNRPGVKQINALRADVRKGDNPSNPAFAYTNGEAVSRVGNYDQLSQYDTVKSINHPMGAVVQDAAGTYIDGTDFLFTDGGRLYWTSYGSFTPSGTAPADTYYVTYTYRKTMTQNTHYQLVEGSEVEELEDGRQYVKFLGSLGANEAIVFDTSFSVDYDYYLARMDLITMHRSGEIIVKKGIPEDHDLVNPPLFRNAEYLNLAEVYVKPNFPNVGIKNISVRRSTMEDLSHLSARVERSEYNQALSDLDNEAKKDYPAFELKGILSDGFIGFTKCDTSHSDFNSAIDVSYEALELPSEGYSFPLEIDEATSGGVSAGRFWFPNYTSKVITKQDKATMTMKINPYSVYTNVSLLSINPSQDTWVEATRIQVDGGDGIKTVTDTTVPGATIKMTPSQLRAAGLMDHRELQQFALHSSGENKYKDWSSIGQLWESDRQETESLVKRLASSNVVLDQAITYMRAITLQLSATNMLVVQGNPEVSDHLQVFFNGMLLDDTYVTPDAGFAGSDQVGLPGSLKANASGQVRATISLPGSVFKSGTALVELKNVEQSSETTFIANGRRQLIEDIYVTDRHTEIIRTISNVIYRDPVAQTFNFEQDQVLTGIDLHFATKDTHSVTFMVRDVVNGYPGPNILYEHFLSPDEINVPTNPTSPASTPLTHIEFETPVHCEENTEYCFVLITQSDYMRVFCAELGENDLLTSEQLTRHPYLGGVMFSSSNNSAWTSHQTRAMKFTMYAAEFEAETIINFDEMDFGTGLGDNKKINQILSALTVRRIPENCNVELHYQVDDDGIWRVLYNYLLMDLPKLTETVKVRAKLISLPNICPFIIRNGNNFLGWRRTPEGTYITRLLTMDEKFNTISVSFDAYLPEGSSVDLRFITDDGITNSLVLGDVNEWEGDTEGDIIEVRPPQRINAFYKRYFYEAYKPEGAKMLKLALQFTNGASYGGGEALANRQLDGPVIKRLTGVTRYQIPEPINAVFFDPVPNLVATVSSGTIVGEFSISGGYGYPTFAVTGGIDAAKFNFTDRYKLIVATGEVLDTAKTYQINVTATDQASDTMADDFAIVVSSS